MIDEIKIFGAKEHNLKNITLSIPKNRLIVITGVSGSGKSSLAFDTLYAEGQRRYVESLSTYARQFLGIMNKPNVEKIEGLSPAIAIDQKSGSHNPRSIVGTITEIYDYLRVLFARIGHPNCPNCHIEIARLSVDEIVKRVIDSLQEKILNDPIKLFKFQLLSPIIREKKGQFKDLFDNLLRKGFQQVRIDNQYYFSLDEEINLIKTNKHTVDVVIDQFSFNKKSFKQNFDELKKRITQSVELSLNLSQGLVILNIEKKEDKLFSEKYSCPKCNISLPELEPRLFSFNSPLGACKKCRGIGTVYKFDSNKILNDNLSINEGAILPFNKIFFQETWYIRLLKKALEEEGIDLNQPLKQLTKDQIKVILYGTGKVYRVPGYNRQGVKTVIYEKFDGIINELEKRFFDQEEKWDLEKYIKEETCDQCQGKRLIAEALAVTIDSKNIGQYAEMAIDKLLHFFQQEIQKKITDFELKIAKPILTEINSRLLFLNNVGLGYLSLNREAKTLAGGEVQRIRLASQIGSGLTGIMYVLDEPSIGLHPRDIDALIETLKRLRDLGNTVIVVEHDPKTILSADYIIELGPKAGENGGRVVFAGTVDELKNKSTLTSQYLFRRKNIPKISSKLNTSSGSLFLKGASLNNLKNISVNFPLGNLIGVSGVSGSGKSTLIVDTLYPALKYYLQGYYQKRMGKFDLLDGYQYVDKVYLVDQSPIGRTPRSNPATYVGFFDDIRELFAQTIDAKMKGFNKSRFSFNLKGGRCEKCQGSGLIKIEMQFLSDVYVKCDVCDGHRYNGETLSVKLKDKNIYEVLEMSVDEAYDFFENYYSIRDKLQALKEIGLGYIRLGQSAPTLSGGEAQRIKLATELIKSQSMHTIYILDEPTTGLHLYDIEKLTQFLIKLVKKGNTVIVIEHSLEILKNCQYLIDLGPEGGEKGGEVIYQGPIEGITKEKRSYTGDYLKKHR